MKSPARMRTASCWDVIVQPVSPVPASGNAPNITARRSDWRGRSWNRKSRTTTAIRWVIVMADTGFLAYLAPLLVSLAFAGGVYALAYPYFSDDRQKDKRLGNVIGGKGRKFGVLAEV